MIIHKDSGNVARWAARYIASKINANAKPGGAPFVLGLPTGSTPLETYAELIRLYEGGMVSFSNVVTFNMDEYVGLPAGHPQSYRAFMWDNFFSRVDMRKENVNIPDGNASDTDAECRSYEEKIKNAGGIDLFLGGIGEDGHIAFNEPFSSLASRTRVKTLTQDTIKVNSRFFGGDVALVPKTALTVGVGTIMDAREVVILATGAKKAKALYHGIEGGVSHKWTVSALQMHPHGMIICDEPAAGELEAGTLAYFKDIESGNLDPDSIKL